MSRDGAEVVRLAYDPLGRRIEKIAEGVTTHYTYDGEDILRETRSDGTSFTYVHGPGIDEPLAREDGSGTVSYYHADGLGSIVKRTDVAGGVVHEYRYDAWGNIEVGASEPGHAFTAREWDPEIGLYYYRARYYDPNSGRFVSEDPLGSYAGVNFYSYVLNNPATYIDPEGLQAEEVAVGVCVGASGGTCAAAIAAAAAAAAAAVIACASSPECRRAVRCSWQLLADLARCTGKGLCPGAEEADTEACLRRAWDNYRACARGWPRPFDDAYPPPGTRPLPPAIKKPPSQGPGPVPVQ